MKDFTRPFKINAKGAEVARLQEILYSLGYSIPAGERRRQQFGPGTTRAIMEFQLSVGLPGDGFLDTQTRERLVQASQEREKQGGQNQYTVSGYVYSVLDQPLANRNIVAMNVNLAGAGIYDTVESLTDLDTNGGFDTLGHAMTDATGFYTIGFDAQQYRPTASGLAEVVTFATDDDAILGRSALASRSDYNSNKQITGLDITLTDASIRATSEYAALVKAINPLLEASRLRPFQIAGATQQLQFLATQTGQNLPIITLFAQADKLRHDNAAAKLNEELLYAVGRQTGNNLDLGSLALTPDATIQQWIEDSISTNLVQVFTADAITAFVNALHTLAVNYAAGSAGAGIGGLLQVAINDPALQSSFLSAYKNYTGTAQDFWTTHLPSQADFKNRPDVVQSLLLSSQLTVVTGSNVALVGEIKNEGVTSIDTLLSWTDQQWAAAITKSGGVPAGALSPVAGAVVPPGQQVAQYASSIQDSLNMAFPTQKINALIGAKTLAFSDDSVGQAIGQFITNNPTFDFRTSRVSDFAAAIAGQGEAGAQPGGATSQPAAAAQQVTAGLQLLQRLFQVSPSVDAMTALYKDGYQSAVHIASVPSKVFVATYTAALGADVAQAVHDRAAFVARRSEGVAMKMMDYVKSAAPAYVLNSTVREGVGAVLGNATPAAPAPIPDYANLFVSPDMCACADCLSVLSPAAYFVDLLRYLQRSKDPATGNTVYSILTQRRPDLPNLEMTCENSYTVIPYIDLVNEVMEFYVANGDSVPLPAYNTGDATQAELRAQPQNTLETAYGILAAAVYPFSLPYHQPLDVIRTYLGNLQTTRLQVMQIFGSSSGSLATNAQAAEQLGLSPGQYGIITGFQLDGVTAVVPPAAPLGYYGYTGGTLAANATDLAKVDEFLARTGVQYTDLVTLLTTQYINPGQNTLNILQTLFGNVSGLDPNTLYTELKSGSWTTDTKITGLLGTATIGISNTYFQTFLTQSFANFQQLVTLFVPSTAVPCDLSMTTLLPVQDIYEGTTSTTLMSAAFANLSQFIRLWNITGYTIQNLDILITALNAALGGTGITAALIENIALAQQVNTTPQLPLQQLCCIWGDIDTFSTTSTYSTLFLGKAQNIDAAFVPDALGGYFTSSVISPGGGAIDMHMSSHIPTLLSAFQLSAADYNAIVADILVQSGSTIDLSTAMLSVHNLSLIYRYVVLAGAIDLSVSDLILLKQLFNVNPFTNPAATLQLMGYATQVTNSGFQLTVMSYIFSGGNNIAPSATFGLGSNTILSAYAAITAGIAQVDVNHPDSEMTNPTEAMLRQDMSLIYSQPITEQFIGMLKGTITYQVQLTAPYPVAITVPLAPGVTEQLSYDPAQGLLICTGVLQDADRNAWLTAYAGVTAMINAINSIYAKPEAFISTNFSGIFGTSFTTAYQNLLNHPAAAMPLSLAGQYQWFYTLLLPFLKNQLKESAIVAGVAQATWLDDRTTGILINNDIANLQKWLSASGMTSAYYNNGTFAAPPALSGTDATLSFDWTQSNPASITTNPFSISWQGFICPSVTDDYTFIADLVNCTSLNLLINNEELIVYPGMTVSALALHLAAGTMYPISIQGVFATGSSFTLSWQTATLPKQVIPAGVLFPATEAADFTVKVTGYYASALFITGFALSPDELSYFDLFPADFSNINFNAPTVIHWQRMAAYTALRNALPLQLATLIQVFKQARLAPMPALVQLIANATGWDLSQVNGVITLFAVTAAELVNETVLIELQQAINLALACGLDVSLFSAWAGIPADFNTFYQIALDIKSAVKSKYTDDNWPAVAAQLSNPIRQDQSAALISYLLEQSFPAWSGVIQDADSLYEYFLIDVQMTACMDTSRMVQAIAAAQLIVSRTLMGLETVNGIGPGAIDTGQWEWMQSYSIWGAAREVFLYPEDYLLEPYRDDQSPLFQDFQSDLLQNDITSATAEAAYRTYLDGLSQIANLEVCGTYQDNNARYIHVFARTHAAPYRYYYRYYDMTAGQWWPWQKLPVDIRCQDDKDSASSGVHLIPYVWKNRLFLFWPEFTIKQDPNTTAQSSNFNDMAKQQTGQMAPLAYYEIRLGWTEYKDGAWTNKQLSKEFILHTPIEPDLQTQLKYYQFFPLAWGDTFIILAFLSLTGSPSQLYTIGTFTTNDIQMPFKINNNLYKNDQYTPSPFFMSSGRTDKLAINGHQYFKSAIPYQLLSTAILDYDMGNTFSNPFFFTDGQKPYFVTPLLDVYFDIRYPRFDTIINSFQPPAVMLTDTLLSPEKTGLNLQPGTDAPAIVADNTRTYYSNKALTGSATSVLRKSTEISITRTGYALNPAFGGVSSDPGLKSGFDPLRLGPFNQLAFFSFFHPLAAQLLANLNSGGLDGLFSYGSAQLPAGDGGSQFQTDYNPVTAPGNIGNVIVTPLPAVGLDFSASGAYSGYNWEIFFHAPLLIATTLSSNGQYADAMKWFQYIFNPFATTGIDKNFPDFPMAEYWNFVPFKSAGTDDITDFLSSLTPDPTQTGINPATGHSATDPTIYDWMQNPFNPFMIARGRIVAFMKNVVMKFMDNAMAWADSYYANPTMENITQAVQLYVMVSHVLGPQPQSVPARGVTASATFNSLSPSLDDFSNALVQLENIFPYSSTITAPSTPYTGNNLLGIGSTLYFCVPDNDQLLQYWTTVAGRLFNIRHCLNMQGLQMQLALFQPIINPALLVAAAAGGISIGSVLSDMDTPAPLYRFTYLMQKASDFCMEVKNLGSAVLSAIEKGDKEEFDRLHAGQEVTLLNMMTEVRNRQVLDAQATVDALTKSREIAQYRLQYYNDSLLGNADISIPDTPTLPDDMDSTTALPADTMIADVNCPVNVSVMTDSGVVVIPMEEQELSNLNTANNFTLAAGISEVLAGGLHLIPQVGAHATPIGVGVAVGFGGNQLGGGGDATARNLHTIATQYSYDASRNAKMASYTRREQEWVYQANLAIRDIIQFDKQLVGANIRLQIANFELKDHLQQVANAQDVADFLQGKSIPHYNTKFTTAEMYGWMKNQIFRVFQPFYQMAYSMAKKAEKAYQFELGIQGTSFIQYGYWNSTYQGLTSGEQLYQALKQMEQSYLEENVRYFELMKNIPLSLVAPDALLTLIETGTCLINLPEELFDLDFPGHYFRRIKSVGITIPCIAGPYTTVNATLSLLQNNIRIQSTLTPNYVQNNVNGIPASDSRFISNAVPFTSIATSSAQNDSGVFELNFRDERYLPFEGAGVISQWELRLNGKYVTSKNKLIDLTQFDYDSISDIILSVRYTSVADNNLQSAVYTHLQSYITNGPFLRCFSMKSDFPEAFYQLFNSASGTQSTQISLTNLNFPFLFEKQAGLQILQLTAYLRPGAGTTAISNANSLSLFGQTATVSPDPFKTGSAMVEAVYNLVSPLELKGLNPAVQATGLVAAQIDDILIMVQYNAAGK
jgi:Tc toxin complex TcA C-terminal TcB-binding domain/Neuraminidase-like domain/Salmonella virulence plasmid 28.1kDa A protein/PA14 domain/Putative peptidoglycan binding domain